MVPASLLSLVLAGAPPQPADAWAAPAARDAFAAVDRAFEEFRLDAHLPGLAYGIVADGRLVHVRSLGVQDLETNRPVSADTLFRIASMTKAFTALSILKLRDDGRLSLDASAETYLPELRGWSYPTDDSRRLRVRDLLNHTAGFVTDDPWGDRHTPLPEAEFTEMLRGGVPFTRAPGAAFEYSNLGYAMLGRVVANVAKQPYKDYVERTLLHALGMTASGFVVEAAPRERRALGYRWEDDQWRLEPTLAHGAFGAMGGLQTSANEYARYVAWLLAAWPPRDGAESGPVKRATVRELAEGSNFPRVRQRSGTSGASACRQAATYGMGMIVAADCDLGLTLSHGGGYPGYGSHVLLLPDYGVGVFAFANRGSVGSGVGCRRRPAQGRAAESAPDAGERRARGGVPWRRGDLRARRRRLGRRAPGYELPARPRGGRLGARPRALAQASRGVRHTVADPADGPALGRVRLALRARPRQGLAAARADESPAHPGAQARARDALTQP